MDEKIKEITALLDSNRVKQGITKGELAALMGISPATYYRSFESGDFTAKQLLRALKALDITLMLVPGDKLTVI